MLNNILAIVLGYLATIVVVFVGLASAYAIMGADGAFESGTYETTPSWIGAMLVVGFIAAIIGGITCAKASKHSKRAVQGFMLLVVILGVSMIIPALSADPSEAPVVREPGITMGDAMTTAKEPLWVTFSHPVVGVLGILLGATLVCPCTKQKAQDQPSE